MTRLLFSTFACAAAVPLLTIAAPQAPSLRAQARAIPSTQAVEAVKLLSSYADVLGAPDTVAGVRAFERDVLATDTLTLQPNSRLVFSSSSGDRTDRYIFVRTLRVGAEALVTWDHEPISQRVVAPIGKAFPGQMAIREGVPGAPGPDGLAGNSGYPGRSAPTLYLVVNRFEGAPLTIDLRGQDGGEGGMGQTGGDGGIGRVGTRGIAVIGLCQAAAGSGGDGGPGGNGGPGGEGGRGGNGGTVVLLAPGPALESIALQIRADVRAGKGGAGGPGGDGGHGGEGGAAGRAESPCPSGQPGRSGGNGSRGIAGATGADGQAGVFAKTELSEPQIRALQLRGASKK